jgi:hypothetical protein
MPGKLIGLIGAPGSGKTTCAAWLFSQMRIKGMRCEMASEFAKDLFWDESNAWKDQLYVFANQWRMIDRVLCRTDYVVCDSPPILSLFYNRPHSEAFVDLVLEKCHQFDTMLFLLKRIAPYDQEGRRETEAESNRLHDEMSEWLDLYGMPYELVESSVDGWNCILSKVVDNGNRNGFNFSQA